MTLSLAIDTSGLGGAVAIADADGPRSCIAHDSELGYAESLFGLIESALSAAECGMDDIGRVSVVRGPGSFTGLRIGIMTAKGIAYARGIQAWSADTLPLLAAASGDDSDRSVISVVDAGVGHVFASAFQGARCVVEAHRCSHESALRLCSEQGAACIVAASGDRGGEALTQLDAIQVEQVELAPALAQFSARGIAPATLQDPVLLLPNYLVPSQAERVHGVDLSSAVHRPIVPEDWG